MTPEEHKARHQRLFTAFDELAQDFLHHHPGDLMSTSRLSDLHHWAYGQTQHPTEDTTPHIPARCAHCGETVTEPGKHVCAGGTA